MTTSIKASVLHGPKDLRIVAREVESPGADHVQVAIRSTGLCGSDLHYYSHYRNGDILVREPLTLGHESTGVVVAVGSNVTSLSPGDAVALEVGVPCEACELCTASRYNICREISFRSSAKSYPHAQGTLQERINHPARWCHLLPQQVNLSLGSLVEPLSVAIHAVNRAVLQPRARVLVIGAGPVGLLVAAANRIRGARTTVISDVDQGRIDFAVKHRFADKAALGSTKRAQNIEEGLVIAQENATNICSVLGEDEYGGNGAFDVVFECSGVPSCVQTAIYATCPGGKVMMVGMGSPVQTLPVAAAALREVDLCGVFRYANAYPTAIEFLSAKDKEEDYPDFASLITHTFDGLGNIEQAFAMASRKSDDMGKIVLKVAVET